MVYIKNIERNYFMHINDIEFRAKPVGFYKTEWVYGSLVYLNYHNSVDYVDEVQIVLPNGHNYTVSPETTCQFSTLYDNLNQNIFTKDMVAVKDAAGVQHIGVVQFVDGCFEIKFNHPFMIDGQFKDRDYLKCYTANHAVMVIGNSIDGTKEMGI
jgi:hypothetical protein